MKHLILLFTVCLSSAVFASYMEVCEMEAKVITAQNLGKLDGTVGQDEVETVVVVEIKKSIDRGSHRKDACQRHLDDDVKVLKLSEKFDRNEFRPGARIKLSYRFISGRGPTPTNWYSATTWNLDQ